LNTEEQTIWLQDQLKQRKCFQAGRRLIWLSTPSPAMGAVGLLRQYLGQIEQLADPIPAPPVLVIDEVLPSPSPPAASPRFAQLSCLRRHQPR
jgi:hypothetical protein